MKYLLIYLIADLFCVNTFCQKNIDSLNFHNDRLSAALHKIGNKTNLVFSLNPKWDNLCHKLNFSMYDVSLKKALDAVFQGQPVQYSFDPQGIFIISPRDVKGRVLYEDQQPAEGITVADRNTRKSVSTDDSGRFKLTQAVFDSYINVSGIAIEETEIAIQCKTDLTIYVKRKVSRLPETTIIHNGYQDVSKDLKTGSFAIVSNKDFNQKVSSNLLDHLDGLVPGMLFPKNIYAGTNQSNISLRGRSTIHTNAQPLIIIDNFPYAGNIDALNPNDVESVTILKDAAASSIWGASAGNGVIVITTKKGNYKQELGINFSTNLTITGKPNVRYLPQLRPSDYIDLESGFFDHGAYDGILSTSYGLVSPVVDALNARRNGKISPAEVSSLLNKLKQQDVRDDVNRLFYQTGLTQQYALNVSGGTASTNYYVSGSYDNTRTNQVSTRFDRKTITANLSIKLKPELELKISSFLSNNTSHNDNPLPAVSYPYVQLLDKNGIPVKVPMDVRQSYKDTAGYSYLFDWSYRPAQELNLNDKTWSETNMRFFIQAQYKVKPSLDLLFSYQYHKAYGDIDYNHSAASYFVRNLVNTYAQQQAGTVSFPIPMGAIEDWQRTKFESSNGRLQLNYNLKKKKIITLAAFIGAELRTIKKDTTDGRYYGYGNSNTSIGAMDFQSSYPFYFNPYQYAQIPTMNLLASDRFNYLSYFFNFNSTFFDRYTFFASGRIDRSNLFGANANHKEIPLWSTGFAWNLNHISCTKKDSSNLLKLRISYGYSGNIDNSISAYTVATSNGLNPYGSNSNTILNPANPFLHWEKIGLLNVGIDFGFYHRSIEGSFDFYIRKSTGLLGELPLDPTSGFYSYTGNSAQMTGHGFDFSLASKKKIGKVDWYLSLVFSHTIDKVTRYDYPPSEAWMYADPSKLSPHVGWPLYSIGSLKAAPLDPSNGDPRGYLNGQLSKDYAAIVSASPNSLVYSGPINPTYFGTIRNTIKISKLSISCTISGEFGNYFRRNSINYSAILSGKSLGHPDYSKRWQKPGDERSSDIPSLVYPLDPIRDNFYSYSELLVEKADNLRLQSVKLNYDLKNKPGPHILANHINIYLLLENLGIIWKATRTNIDPDYFNEMPAPLRLTVGVKIDL